MLFESLPSGGRQIIAGKTYQLNLLL